MDIKQRIKQAMELRDVTQTALAHAIGIKPQAVQKWLSFGEDGTTPRMSKIPAIAKALSVPESWLLTGIGSPDSEEAAKEELRKLITTEVNELDREGLDQVLAEAKRIRRS